MGALEDDLGLAKLAHSGDRAAAARLVARHERSLWTFLARLGGVDAADDLFQETWSRALPALAGWRGNGAFRGWLMSIGRRVCADRSRHRPLRALEVEPEAGASADDRVVAAERSREVADAIRLLAGRQREAVVLRYVEGLPFRDVAATMGVGEATARKYALEGIKTAASRIARPVEK